MKKQLSCALLYTTVIVSMNIANAKQLTVATFNVSMEALNYSVSNKSANHSASNNTKPNKEKHSDKPLNIPLHNVLQHALETNNQQIKNIAEIIQRTNPDILLLNEFDNVNNTNSNSHKSLALFINRYLNQSQQGQPAINYPYFYQGTVNTGINSGFDLDGNGKKGQLPGDGFGYGHFSGHFGMALLSKYPIDKEKIRTFQHFKWHDMPNALKPISPIDNSSWFPEDVWQSLPLSSKSHWDIPVIVNNKTVHILASHPTPPVFDGPENRNGNRNHDEIRFWSDYISPEKSSYIYDDNNTFGGLAEEQAFVILGDLNASNVDGDAVTAGISNLLNHSNIQDPLPESQGGKLHNPQNINAKNHTAHWGMRADYVLPSVTGFKLVDSAVFWPTKADKNYRLIESRQASSDHRMVWVSLELQ